MVLTIIVWIVIIIWVIYYIKEDYNNFKNGKGQD